MNATNYPLRGSAFGAGLLALVLLLGAAPPSTAAATTSVPAQASPAPVLFADSPWWKQAYDWLAQWLGSRAHLVQFAFIGLIVAIIIICRNRW